MIQFIKVTSYKDKSPVYINPEMIGHMYEMPETRSYGSVDTPAHTVIGVTTHNNGGFKVTETVKEITKLIEKTHGKV